MFRVTIIAIALCLLFGGTTVLFFKKWRDANQEVNRVVELNGTTIKQVEFYKNKSGALVTKNESLQMDHSTLLKLYNDGQLTNLKQFDHLQKRLNNLESYTLATLQIAGYTKVAINPDSSFSYHDQYRNLSGIIKNDSISLRDTTEVPLSIVVYWKRKWFLGKKRFFAEATSKNHAVKISGLEHIDIEAR